MKKHVRLLIIGTVLMFVLSGCSNSDSDNNTSSQSSLDEYMVLPTTEAESEITDIATTEATTEATTDNVATESDSTEVVSYSNSGNNYTLNVDGYVDFIDITNQPTCSVNNEDGLEICYNDVYITIQRFPNNDIFSDVDGFYDYLNGDEFLSMVVAENEVIINNEAVVEQKNQTLELADGNKVFKGYLIYFSTDNGFYKAMISGSDLDVIEHYKNFVDNMTFN